MKFVLIIFAVAVVLFFSNPSKEKIVNHMTEKFLTEYNRTSQDVDITIASMAAPLLINNLFSSVIETENFFLFTIVTTIKGKFIGVGILNTTIWTPEINNSMKPQAEVDLLDEFYKN